MQKNTKTVIVNVQVHKELKKAEVENLFSLPGVTFEVKRRTIFATTEISDYSEKWKTMVEIETYIFETMDDFYLEKCYGLEAEHERKCLAEQEEENKKEEKEKAKLKLSYEEFYENIATVEECSSVDFDGYQYTQKVSVYSVGIFLHFFFEVLESYELEPLWYKAKIDFENIPDFEQQGFEESIGYDLMEEAKEKLNEFFGEGEEREAKFSMLSKNEEIFKNIYDLNY